MSAAEPESAVEPLPEVPKRRLQSLRVLTAQRKLDVLDARLASAEITKSHAQAAVEEERRSAIQAVSEGHPGSTVGIGRAEELLSLAVREVEGLSLARDQAAANLDSAIEKSPSAEGLLEIDEEVEAAIELVIESTKQFATAVLDARASVGTAVQALGPCEGLKDLAMALQQFTELSSKAERTLQVSAFKSGGWRYTN